MSQELVKALLIIMQYCMTHNDCKTCVLRDYCGQSVCAWTDK